MQMWVDGDLADSWQLGKQGAGLLSCPVAVNTFRRTLVPNISAFASSTVTKSISHWAHPVAAASFRDTLRYLFLGWRQFSVFVFPSQSKQTEWETLSTQKMEPMT